MPLSVKELAIPSSAFAARAARDRAARGTRTTPGRPPDARQAPARRRPRAPPAARRTRRASRRSTPHWPRMSGAASRCRPPPSGCSTTSTSFRPPRATSATICRPPSSGGCRESAADEFAGLPRVYALALELIRLQRGPARRAAPAPVRHRVPVGHAADDRRALGVAERAEAGARRAPARRGRTCWPRAARIASDADRIASALEAAPARDGWPARGASRVRHPPAAALARIRRRRGRAAARARRGAGRARATRSRTRSAPKDAIRRPSRRRWRT